MITEYTPQQLASIMTHLYPGGGWSVRDSEIIAIPAGSKMPTSAEMNAALVAIAADQTAAAASAQEQAAKKTALFLDLKTRLSTDLGIEITSPADLAGKIEDIIPAARARRTAKTTTSDRLNELEKQVELLTTFVALLSRH